jgi:hypothetical protein
MTADGPTPRHANGRQRVVNLGNVSAAAIGLGASLVFAFLLPTSIFKVAVGVAAIVAVLTIGVIVYRRMNLATAPATGSGEGETAETTTSGR